MQSKNRKLLPRASQDIEHPIVAVKESDCMNTHTHAHTHACTHNTRRQARTHTCNTHTHTNTHQQNLITSIPKRQHYYHTNIILQLQPEMSCQCCGCHHLEPASWQYLHHEQPTLHYEGQTNADLYNPGGGGGGGGGGEENHVNKTLQLQLRQGNWSHSYFQKEN